MSNEIARAIEAIEEFDVSYETNSTDTIIEAENTDEIFSAVQAAHDAVDSGRVITSLEVDEQRGREQHISDRTVAVQTALGHPPRRDGGS